MQHLAISAASDGFRRAGRAWQRKAEIVAASDLDPAQLELLQADPNITVTPVAAEQRPAAELAARAGATVDELREALIRAGIGTLEPGRKDHWTAAGLPEIAALRTATGLASISAAERDRVWGEIQQGA